MKFEASIELNKLHDVLKALSVVVDEAKFTISEEGITSHMRDPSNVLEVLLKIKKEAFQSWDYEGTPQEIALLELGKLVDKLAELQEIIEEEEGNYSMSEGLALSIDESANQLVLSRGDFTDPSITTPRTSSSAAHRLTSSGKPSFANILNGSNPFPRNIAHRL